MLKLNFSHAIGNTLSYKSTIAMNRKSRWLFLRSMLPISHNDIRAVPRRRFGLELLLASRPRWRRHGAAAMGVEFLSSGLPVFPLVRENRPNARRYLQEAITNAPNGLDA